MKTNQIKAKLKEYPVYADMALTDVAIGLLMLEQKLVADHLHSLPSSGVKAWIGSRRGQSFVERYHHGVQLAEPMAPPNPLLEGVEDLKDLRLPETSGTDRTDSEAGQDDGNSEASENPPNGSEYLSLDS